MIHLYGCLREDHPEDALFDVVWQRYGLSQDDLWRGTTKEAAMARRSVARALCTLGLPNADIGRALQQDRYAVRRDLARTGSDSAANQLLKAAAHIDPRIARATGRAYTARKRNVSKNITANQLDRAVA